ncbi:zinc finger and SCAN domain-containing protein 4-like isoform X2 [Gigantopelta aegis]|uniref:zinc finger and SCAN domain-containing protein 4-like isoform X2 n=1 Tax=Gigantopelta aegis TaxID=1735272 RepID=UPI001B889D75|nr:zinc finger and SCAN domain-containing protein 4-like isoform X2 [Gigantopelta aegis]
MTEIFFNNTKPIQPFLTLLATGNRGDNDVADVLTKMNYRVCYDGFYIPSPDAPSPTESPAFTFDGLYPVKTVHQERASNFHSPGHRAKNSAMFTEANTYLMERILKRQHLQALPSCQYAPRYPDLRFTLNIAESIMTEESSIKYHSIPDISWKSPNESILDDAIDNIDERDDENDGEEKSAWKAKEEKDIPNPDDHDAILSLAISSTKLWRPHETENLTPSQPEAMLHRASLTNKLWAGPEKDECDAFLSVANSSQHRCETPLQIHPSNSVSFRDVAADSTKQPDGQPTTTDARAIQSSLFSKLQKMGRTSIPMKRERKHIVCDICGKGFSQSGTMRSHRRTHTGERPYQCDVCQKSFGDRSTWRKHRRVHTRDRPFTCDVCGKSFAQSGNVARHKRTMHADDI